MTDYIMISICFTDCKYCRKENISYLFTIVGGLWTRAYLCSNQMFFIYIKTIFAAIKYSLLKGKQRKRQIIWNVQVSEKYCSMVFISLIQIVTCFLVMLWSLDGLTYLKK